MTEKISNLGAVDCPVSSSQGSKKNGYFLIFSAFYLLEWQLPSSSHVELETVTDISLLVFAKFLQIVAFFNNLGIF